MKPAKRKAPKQIAAAGHEPAFREIIGLIAAARRAFQAVNTELIDLYGVSLRQLSHQWCDKLIPSSKLSTLSRQLR
jgi:hypothetical protein